MGNKLYVGNLDYQTTSEDLANLFAGAGAVLSAHVIMDRETQTSKGFAFVEMGTDAEALRAISLFNGHMLEARALNVSEARPREGQGNGTNRPRVDNRPKFREIRHKARGGRKARNY